MYHSISLVLSNYEIYEENINKTYLHYLHLICHLSLLPWIASCETQKWLEFRYEKRIRTSQLRPSRNHSEYILARSFVIFVEGTQYQCGMCHVATARGQALM